MNFKIEEYVVANGRKPYTEWLKSLRSQADAARIAVRVRRAVSGNFGDWKALSGVRGVYEMRMHHGPGYRVFYAIVGNGVVLLLGGSTKRDQEQGIAKAQNYYADYQSRKKDQAE